MRLEEINGRLLNEALAICCRYAWSNAYERRCAELVSWAEDDSGEALLNRLAD